MNQFVSVIGRVALPGIRMEVPVYIEQDEDGQARTEMRLNMGVMLLGAFTTAAVFWIAVVAAVRALFHI